MASEYAQEHPEPTVARCTQEGERLDKEWMCENNFSLQGVRLLFYKDWPGIYGAWGIFSGIPPKSFAVPNPISRKWGWMTHMLVRLCLPSCLVLAGAAAKEFVSGPPGHDGTSAAPSVSWQLHKCQCTSQNAGKAAGKHGTWRGKQNCAQRDERK